MFSTERGAGPWTPFPQVLPAGEWVVSGLRNIRRGERSVGMHTSSRTPVGAAPRGLGTAIATAPPARGASRGACERGVPGFGGPTVVEPRWP